MEALKSDIENFLAVTSGDGSGYGSGDGSGDGSGISSYNGQKVYYIDDLPTLIDHIYRNYAYGHIIQKDLTLTPCYVARVGNSFAHGSTLHEALQDARQKELESMPVERKIDLFLEQHPDRERKYPARDFYDWHHTLTGSCDMGRRSFCQDHGIDVDNDTFTVAEFIGLTEHDYGGNVIRQLKNRMDECTG